VEGASFVASYIRIRITINKNAGVVFNKRDSRS
jgi:hypothetical protein